MQKIVEVVYNQISRQREKARFFTFALDFINEVNVVGDYFEFGCHRCRTFRMVLTEARRHNLDHMGFLAFDSFEGLPGKGEAGNINWDKGTLTTSEEDFMQIVKNQGIYVDKVKTYKGTIGQRIAKKRAIVTLEQGNSIDMSASI